MRRLRDRRPAPFFRGGELPRLVSLVAMLGLLVLLIDVARDPKTWRWVAPDLAGADEPMTEREVVVAGEPASGPSDLDADELDAAREEFDAVTDKVPLAKEEMPAYWRLVAWQQHQSTRQMRERADKKVTFKQLWQQPAKWRGKLVEIPLHLKRTERVEDLADNALGLKSLDEVWGWNSDSQPYWYWLVVPELPPGMPRGGDIYEEATFVGYFLKLLPYEDRQGISRATPLLVGRLIWHPLAPNALARGEWTWPWIAGGGALVLLAVVRWGFVWFGWLPRKRIAGDRLPRDEDAVAAWLDGTEDAAEDENRDADAD
jgi:hypothetical protein